MYLNLNRAAWRRIARSGKIPFTTRVWGQRHLAAPYFSLLQGFQDSMVGVAAPLRDDPLIVLGYWRSGTTLLHEYLALDPRLIAPTNYACMNPHHFVLTQAGARAGEMRRPMDSIVVSSTSPGEDEFALLGLGAPSPYEALLFPNRMERVLLTADPADLPAEEGAAWEHAFRHFLLAVHHVEGDRQLVLKSPTHGFRVATLARLFPRARFIHLVREPLAVFESVVRMWQSLCSLYAFAPLMPDDAVREIVLTDRLRFEEKLWQGLGSLPPKQQVLLRFEDLVAQPAQSLERVYDALGMEGFDAALPKFCERAAAVSAYSPASVLPESPWRARVMHAWKPISDRYGYT